MLTSTTIFAQNDSFRFLKITSADGLSQNLINHIIQDEWGYLWFASQDGLNRYDGYQFTVFRPNQENEWSISDNFIRRLVPVQSGDFWILARYGLNYYERKSDRFYKFLIRENNYQNIPNSIFEWKGKTMALFSYKAYALPDSFQQATTLLMDSFNLPSDSITAACNCNEYTLFMDQSNLIIYSNESHDTSIFKVGFKVTYDHQFEVFENEVFLAAEKKILRFDCRLGSAGFVDLKDFDGDIQSVWKRLDGSIWVGHTEGVDVIDSAHERFKLRHDPRDERSLSYPLVHSLFEDRAGTMWIGTANGGLNYLPKGSEHFTHYSEHSGLFNHQVWSVYKDDSGLILVGTETGLNFIQNGKVQDLFPVISNQFREMRITALTKDKYGQYWIGTSVEGLFRTPNLSTKATKIFIEGNNQYQQSISCFKEIGESMWVGTLGYLHRVGLKGKLERSFIEGMDGNRMAYILSLNADSNNLYVGAAQGLFICNLQSEKIEPFIFQPGGGVKRPSFQFITGIEPDGQGKVWLSTFGGGLNAFNLKEKTFEFYGVQNGLSNGIIAGMKRFDHELWLAHNQGLSCFNIQTKKFRNYGLNDGVPFPEFSLGGGFKTVDGQFMFAGTDGLVILRTTDLASINFEAIPTLSEIKINYGQSGTILSESPENLTFLELHPGDHVVSFRFVVPDFIHGESFEYEYKMEGFDSRWIDASAIERRATYSNLPAGQYKFRVRVTDQNGNMSSNELSIPIKVIPPFWQRTWFVVLSSIALLGLIIFIVRYFSQLRMKKQLRELELKHRIHKERERISMDLHDHVGAQITYLISNLDRLGIRDSESAGNIKGLGKYAREAMRELRDTVWTIRKDAMPVSEMMQRIAAYANGLFQDSNTQFKLTRNMQTDLELEPSIALHLMRILQESIQNIQKHAQADKVEISVSTTESELVFEISDNGVGFSDQAIDENEHNGLRNIKDRASEMQAFFSIVSKLGIGTTIRIGLQLKSPLPNYATKK